MKRSFKKLGAVVLALAMCMSLACTAFAAGETDGKITITNVPASDQVFEAWQIFAGDLGTDGKTLSNITWGSGVTVTEETYTDLAAIVVDGEYPFTDENGEPLTSAAEVAKVMDEEKYNSEIAQAFADVMHKYVSTTKFTSQGSTEAADGTYNYVINVGEYGYYLIDDAEVGEHEAYTDYLLTVVDADATIVAKEDYPPIDKVITDVEADEDNTEGTVGDQGKASNASIGDSVDFQLTSQVPSMIGYTYYYFIVTDSLSSGLTFNNDVKITIGGTELTVDTDYTVNVTENADGTTTVQIVFHDFIQYKESNVGDAIVITYSATLNSDAVIGTAGNPNDVYLTYSNDPNAVFEPGTDDIPNPDDPVGETPHSETYTYTTGIELTKTDETGNTLTGAQFTISGESVNIVVTVEGVYTIDEDGTYYLLKDGTYTQTAPTEATADKYEDPDVKYSFSTKTQVEEGTKESDTSTNYEVSAWVDENGVVRFSGLSEGTYTITETVTPDGYNTIDPMEVVITWTAPAETDETMTCSWTATCDGEDVEYNSETGVFEITVVNNAGTTLPSTGGIGTTIFYIIGGVLVVGAVVVLVTRRRMNREA